MNSHILSNSGFSIAKSLQFFSLALSLMASPVCSQVVTLAADNNDFRDKIPTGKVNAGQDMWLKRYDAGKNSWGIRGTLEVLEGKMGFTSFPGTTGTYKVLLGAVLEPDGNPDYKVSAAGVVLGQGQFPFAEGKTKCDEASASEAKYLELGEHQLTQGATIEVWGRSTYECNASHGAYTRWYELRFEPVLSGVDTVAPTVPTGMVVDSVTSSSIGIHWNAATDAGSGVSEYQIFLNDDSVARTATTSYIITGLNADSSYHIKIRSVDVAKNVSSFSSAITVRTLAGAIQAPLTMISPNGGESFLPYQKIPIRWSGDGTITDVKIHVSANGGKTWEPITTQSVNIDSPDWGNYLWSPENKWQGMACLRIRVADYEDGNPSVKSKSDFGIEGAIAILQMPGIKGNTVLRSRFYFDILGRINHESFQK